MDKEHFSKLLTEQQERGKNLLSLISTMHESQNDFGDGMAMFGGEDLYSVPEDELEDFKNKFAQWKSYVYELLEKQFGRDDQYVYDWDTYVVTHISKRKPILNQLKKNVNKGLSLLSSFLERLDIHYHDKGYMEENNEQENIAKSPKVFISHKKEDKPYADALVNLINFILGADGDKIFCSSIPGYGIRQSRDILDELKNQFDRYDVFMVIIHSPRYYQSAICLNEMGASWALGTKFSSFMTIDCKPEHLHGVINREKICIDLNDDDDMLNCHLNEFKDDLIDFFHAGQLDQNRWENARGRFVREVKALTYESPASKPSEGVVNTIDATVSFTEEEYDVLRQWVESGNNSAHVLGVLGGKYFVFGNIQYFAENGRQEARWKAFLKKLQDVDFVELDRYDSHGTPVYELQNNAYEFLGID